MIQTKPREYTREQFLDEFCGSIWLGGARYWRGQVWYRPTWELVDARWESIWSSRDYWAGPPTMAWFVYLKRVDDNSASCPPGRVTRWGLHCLEGFNKYEAHFRRAL